MSGREHDLLSGGPLVDREGLLHEAWYWFGPVMTCLIFVGGIFSFGYAPYGPARAWAWLGCALLGAWGLVFWAQGRYSAGRFPLITWVWLFFLGTIAWAGIQLVPLPGALAAGLSPLWRETFEAMRQSGYEVPERVPLAAAPESAWRSWNQMIAGFLFFTGACVAASRRRGFVVMGTAVVLFSVIESWLGGLAFVFGTGQRARAFLFNPNHHAAAVMMGLPIALWWIGRRHQPDEYGLIDSERTDRTLLLGGLLAVAFVGWLLALSRGSLIALMVVFAADFVFRVLQSQASAGGGGRRPGRRSRGLLRHGWIALLIVVSGVVMVLFSEALGQLATRFEESREFEGRVAYWLATLKGLAMMPLTGMGLGGAEFAINRFLADRSSTVIAVYSHNDYVQAVSELGVLLGLGAVCFLFALIRRFRGEWFETSSSVGHTGRGFRRAALVAVAITLVHSLFEFHLRTPMVGFQFLILSALVLTGNKVMGSR